MFATRESLPLVKKWAFKNNVFIRKADGRTKKKDDREYTHLLLDGGKWHVSYDQLDTFRRKYAASLAIGEQLFICEAKTPVFHMMSDLDFFDKTLMSYEIIREYVCEIQDVIYDFYIRDDNELDIDDEDRFVSDGAFMNDIQQENRKPTPEELKVIVCTTEPKYITKEGDDLIKTGVHLVWPKLTIIKKNALILRHAIIQRLEKKYGKRPAYNIWEDVVDKSVYEKNGLRMTGSAKMSICKMCRGKQRDMDDICTSCYGQGKIYEGRIYLPVDVIDGIGVSDPVYLEKIQEPYQMVCATSIVCYDSKPNFSFLRNYPDWYDDMFFEFDEINPPKRNGKAYPLGEYRTRDDQVGLNEHKVTRKVPESDVRFNKIVRFIRKVMPDVYNRVQILDIQECLSKDVENQAGNNYFVARTNSTFCMNVARNHSSNTIYFLLNKFGIYQKCFSRKDTTEGRKFGRCSEYASKLTPLTEELRSMLYPTFQGKQYGGVICELHRRSNYDINPTKYMNDTQRFVSWLEDDILGKSSYEKRFSSKRKAQEDKKPKYGRRRR